MKEVGQRKKYDIIYTWNLKCNTNELIYERLTAIDNSLVVAKGAGM